MQTASDTRKPKVLLGSAANPVALSAGMANRHGLIAGATGTGKTVTLQVLAEGFSRIGVPVFAADIKGDLSGLAQEGQQSEKIRERIALTGISNWHSRACPVRFWDLFGRGGLPVRASVDQIGAPLLAHLLELNETQEGVLHIAFRVSESDDLPIHDLADLQALLRHVAERATELSQRFGRVAPGSVAAIQRRLLVLEDSGAKRFFGRPALDIQDFILRDAEGQGIVNLLDARHLLLNPRLYTTFLFWLLTELFRVLPEVGDPEKPILVFFFDEAHLLFDQAPEALLQRLEQVVRLIRSKGVGIYFITQNPDDVSETVLGQLGNKIQHALRAYTPRDRKAVRAAAESFRNNPAFDTETVLGELGTGEALVSVLDEKGRPLPVERTLVVPPQSRIGPLEEPLRQHKIASDPLVARYGPTLNLDSAEERLERQRVDLAREAEADIPRQPVRQPVRRNRSQSYLETFLKSLLRGLGGRLGRRLLNGLLKALGGRR